MSLLLLGFTENPYDIICVFNKTVDGNPMSEYMWMDALLVVISSCISEKQIVEILIISQFENVYKTVSYGNYHNKYLGMEFTIIENYYVKKVDMSKYIQDVITEYDVQGTNNTSPESNKLFNINELGGKLSDKKRELFHTIVAKLLYLAKRTS